MNKQPAVFMDLSSDNPVQDPEAIAEMLKEHYDSVFSIPLGNHKPPQLKGWMYIFIRFRSALICFFVA